MKQTQSNLQSLMKQSDSFDTEQRLLAMADSADAAAPHYAEYQRTKNALIAAQDQQKSAQTKQTEAQKTLLDARQARELHEAGQVQYTQEKERMILLENARDLYNTLGQKKDALDAAQKRQKRCLQDANEKRKAFSDADEAWIKAQLAQSRAMGDYQNAQRIYLSGIGGVLAQQLVEGMACPVCGSGDRRAGERMCFQHWQRRNRWPDGCGGRLRGRQHGRKTAGYGYRYRRSLEKQ